MLTIFIVEDSPLMSKHIEAEVADIPEAEIIGIAETVEGAIEGIAESNPDVVLLDFRLKDGTGLDVLKAIKKSGNPPIVIVLTSLSNSKYREISLMSGADHFFYKSTDFTKVFDLIRVLAYRDN